LQAIIAVGFKVNSARAVQFRKWVNQIAKDYTIQGWAIDKERLKNGGSILTKEYAETEFEKYRIIQDKLFESDFDKFLKLENNINIANQKKKN
jgi:hypothetical protein